MDDLEQIRQRKLHKLMIDIQAEKDRVELLPKELLEKDEKVWPATPVHVKDYEFLSFIALYPFVIIDCWAPWCGPCRQLEPVIGLLAKKFQGKVVFGKVNTDENQILARQLQVMSIPTLLFYKDGVLVNRATGFITGNRLEQMINQYQPQE